MKRRTGTGKAAAAAQAAAMFETGTDPFGRPVAWATIERTGEQLALAPVSTPIRGDLVEVFDDEAWRGPYLVDGAGRAYVTVQVDGRSCAYAATDVRRVSRTRCEECGCPLAAGHRFCSATCAATDVRRVPR